MSELRFITTRSIEFLETERRIRNENFMRWLEDPKGSKIPLWTKFAGGEWRGQSCFVIGGGPSLRGFDFSQLKKFNFKIIVCNRGFVEVPFADMMIALDFDLYNWILSKEVGRTREEQIQISKAFREFKGLRVWIDMNNNVMDAPVHYVFRESRPIIHKKIRNGIFAGNNVGIGALCLAVTLGASPIYLLGYDFYIEKNRTHFHSGYPRKMTESHVHSFLVHFNMIAPAIKRRAEVYNLNRRSKLRKFAFMDLKDIEHD